MSTQFNQELINTRFIHKPLPIDREEFAEAEIRQKEAVAIKSLSPFTSLNGIYTDNESTVTLTDNILCFHSPTRTEDWHGDYARIYETTYLTIEVPKEDWQAYNRIYIRIRPDLPGFKFVSAHIQLVNEGPSPLPDRYQREGFHHLNLRNQEWNELRVEMEHLPRTCITAFKIGYDMIGNENEAVSTANFYISDIRLETITSPEKYKGWETADEKIVLCGTGYRPGTAKFAYGHKLPCDTFRVIDAATGKTVLKDSVKTLTNPLGSFSVLDFSRLCKPGLYLLSCGELFSRTFPVSEQVWEDSIWKTINLFFCQRCGYEVPGKHKCCHQNVVNHHGDKAVVANGGWHDAADMSQTLTNTAEAVYAFFLTAEKQKLNTLLFERLIEEGKWGLDWMLKTRFGDGYRDMGSGTSVWTSGFLGAKDQIDSQAQNFAIENFMSAATEALASFVLAEIDKPQSQYLVEVAKEDFSFAYERLYDKTYEQAFDPARVSSPLVLYSSGLLAACHLYRITKEHFYIDKCVELADLVMACQQRTYPDWDIPLTGFFYRDEEHTQIQHYNHRSHEHEPIKALQLLCKTLPNHPNWSKWYFSVLLYSQYLKEAAKITAPYSMLPASIYHIGEADADPELFLNQQAFAHPGMLAEYRAQVENGVALGNGYYLKRFPVWFSYRGNSGLVLANGNAALYSALCCNDYELYELAQRQLEWIVGKNPFNQSLMIGEGHNFSEQYVCLPGHMSGSLCVGIESYEEEDSPYWPPFINAVHREVWSHPSVRWLLLTGNLCAPAKIYGYMTSLPGSVITVRNLLTQEETTITTHPRTGEFHLPLPCGRYKLTWNGLHKELNILPGKEYEITDTFTNLSAKYQENKDSVFLTVTISSSKKINLSFRTENLDITEKQWDISNTQLKLKASIKNSAMPWFISVIPDGALDHRLDISQKGAMLYE